MAGQVIAVDEDRLSRLIELVYKLAGWLGADVTGLIEDEYLEVGDLDRG